MYSVKSTHHTESPFSKCYCIYAHYSIIECAAYYFKGWLYGVCFVLFCFFHIIQSAAHKLWYKSSGAYTMRAHNINCVWGSSSSAVYMYSLGYFSHIEFKSDLNQIKSRLIRIIAHCKSFLFFFFNFYLRFSQLEAFPLIYRLFWCKAKMVLKKISSLFNLKVSALAFVKHGGCSERLLCCVGWKHTNISWFVASFPRVMVMTVSFTVLQENTSCSLLRHQQPLMFLHWSSV